MPPATTFSVILFDLGGVLLDFSGAAELGRCLRPPLPAAEMWAMWLQSPAVRAFETGQLDLHTFAATFIHEAQLTLTPAELLAQYASWYHGVFPDVPVVLAQLRTRYKLGLLSNINHYYWERVQHETTLLPAFDYLFASHLLGMLKPDAALFDYVVQQCSVPPAQILFLDDNQLNVDAAQRAGLTAYRTVGFAAVQQQLHILGLLP